MKKKKPYFVYLTQRSENGEWFAVRTTAGGNKFNFWQITPGHSNLYTFQKNEVYNAGLVWTEMVCKELLSDLHSATPCVDVMRLAVDGAWILNLMPGNEQSPVPTIPKRPEDWDVHLQKVVARAQLAEIEERKCAEPAPFILYGKHPGRDKEFAWRLTPDKPYRQNIQPGDTVLVWTKFGFKKAVVTRIEKAEDKEQPQCRVKKKIEKSEDVLEKGKGEVKPE